ncbi:GMC oxidoreductase [Colletotrichum tofieldiae]|nr:GMC oxidoreductase [Colletotrichum tofieldiae]
MGLSDAIFDYVIVGSGTAGLEMANRLSAKGDVTVAVIEAGTFYQITNPVIGNTPAGETLFAGSSPLDTNPLVDWNFVNQAQAGANNRRIHYARVKCLGGAPTLSPAGGPLDVSYANYAQPFSTYLEPSLNEIGILQAQDFNSDELMGAQYCTDTIQPDSQKRESSQTSFLGEAIGRKNLKVYQLSLAKKILFDNNKRATGVVVSSNLGLTTYTLKAHKEVILSAGAFQSLQLLFKTPVIAERPGVDKHIEDHVFFGPTWRVKVQTLTRLANDLIYTAAQFAIPYSILKQGPLTNPVYDFLGWEKTPRDLISAEAAAVLDNELPPDWPEIEYLTAPGYVGDFANLLLTQPKDGYQYATTLGGLVAPLSKGTVTLASADTKCRNISCPAAGRMTRVPGRLHIGLWRPWQ